MAPLHFSKLICSKHDVSKALYDVTKRTRSTRCEMYKKTFRTKLSKTDSLLRQEGVLREPVCEGYIYCFPGICGGFWMSSSHERLLHWRIKIVNGHRELVRDFDFLQPEWLLCFPFCEITEWLHACRSVRGAVITIIFLRAISLILQFANFL